jgi:hypothetical protein
MSNFIEMLGIKRYFEQLGFSGMKSMVAIIIFSSEVKVL